VAKQNECTDSYFSQFSGLRDQFYSKLSDSFTYDKFSVPWQKGPYVFFSKKTGLQNQYVYYVYESVDDEPRVLLDPNSIRADGTAAVKGPWISDDGLKMAYGVSLSGSDWFTIHVRDVRTCEVR
jgi:prolyl oligopeptidase